VKETERNQEEGKWKRSEIKRETDEVIYKIINKSS
jgi:hypothetical protein